MEGGKGGRRWREGRESEVGWEGGRVGGMKEGWEGCRERWE